MFLSILHLFTSDRILPLGPPKLFRVHSLPSSYFFGDQPISPLQQNQRKKEKPFNQKCQDTNLGFRGFLLFCEHKIADASVREVLILVFLCNGTTSSLAYKQKWLSIISPCQWTDRGEKLVC